MRINLRDASLRVNASDRNEGPSPIISAGIAQKQRCKAAAICLQEESKNALNSWSSLDRAAYIRSLSATFQMTPRQSFAEMASSRGLWQKWLVLMPFRTNSRLCDKEAQFAKSTQPLFRGISAPFICSNIVRWPARGQPRYGQPSVRPSQASDLNHQVGRILIDVNESIPHGGRMLRQSEFSVALLTASVGSGLHVSIAPVIGQNLQNWLFVQSACGFHAGWRLGE